MFNKKLEDFIPYEKIIPILGEQSCEGVFSIIEPAEYNRIKVAVKKPRKINNKRKEISIDEIRKHDYFYCKNVINFRGITRSPNEIDCLVMDYAEKGNLHKYLSEHPLELDVKLKMSINIAEGLFECHRHKIMNLNINSENILVDKNLELKIGGFGYNINRDFDNEDFVRWAAPEKFSEDSQCKENPILSDIYSYGLVVWEIATNGKEPYADRKNDEIKSTKTSGNNDYLIYELEQIDTPNRLIKIIKDCCNSNPSMRSTLAKVILDLKSLYDIKSQETFKNDPKKLALFYFREEKYEDLIQHLSKLLEVDEKNAFALKYRGAAYYFLKEYEKSKSDLSDSLFIDENDPFALKYLGAVYREMGDYEQSKELLTESLNIEPNDSFALRERGATYFFLNRYEESLEDLNNLIKIDSNNISAINYLRKIYLKPNERLEDSKKFAQSLRQHGESHFEIKKYNESFTYFDTSLDIEPENVSALSYRGSIYRLFFKKLEKALVDLDEALKIDPNYEFALNEREKTRQSMRMNNNTTRSPPREDWRLFLPRTHDDAKLPEYTSIQNCSDKDLTWEEIFMSPGKLNIEFLERGLRLMILKIEEHDSEFFTNYLKNDLSKDDNGLWLLFFESEKCDLEIDRIYYDKNCGFIQFKDDEKYSKLKFDSFGLDYKKINNESERSIINFRIIYEAGIIDKENSVQIMDPNEYKFEKQKIELRKKEFKDKAKNISTMYSSIEKHIDEAQYHQKIEGINLEMLKEKKNFNHEEWNKRLIWLSDRANYALFRFKLKKSNLALLNKYFFKDKYILNQPQLNDETELILYDKRLQFYVSSESLPAFKQIPDYLNVIISIVDDYDKTFHQHYSKYKEFQLKEYVYDNSIPFIIYMRKILHYESYLSIITLEHAAEISSWIDRRSTTYKINEVPYEFKLLLRGSRDGFGFETFHKLCDCIPNLVVVVKVENSNEILGGYNPLGWKSRNSEPTSAPGSFIFSFKKGNMQESILSRIDDKSIAIYNNQDLGPWFSNFGFQKYYKYKEWYYSRHRNFYQPQIRSVDGYFSIDDYVVFQICKNA